MFSLLLLRTNFRSESEVVRSKVLPKENAGTAQGASAGVKGLEEGDRPMLNDLDRGEVRSGSGSFGDMRAQKKFRVRYIILR